MYAILITCMQDLNPLSIHLPNSYCSYYNKLTVKYGIVWKEKTNFILLINMKLFRTKLSLAVDNCMYICIM